MGGPSSDENQANEFVSGANKTRANAARNKKQRDDAFKTYEQYPGDMLQTDKRVLDNIKIATDLENKARTSQINLPVPTIGSIAMNTVSSINYNNQAKQLRSGGNAVFDDKGDYQGVVGKGTFGGKVYSGNADYSPIGRSQGASFNSATGTYTSSKMQSSGGDDNSQSSNNTPSNTQTTAIDKTDSTTSLSTASRRALISGGGGGASRRNLI